MDDYRINPIIQNHKLKQFVGWFLAILFPFTVRGVMDITKIPILAAIIYLLIGGVFLRLIIDGKLPYLNIQIGKVKKETIALMVMTLILAYVFSMGFKGFSTGKNKNIINGIIFALINGSLEQLVWVNIFDLAGCRIKLSGFIASSVYVILINALFWNKFVPAPINYPIFIVMQIVLFVIPFLIYVKTEDITLWSIQHVIYNLILFFMGGFGINSFIHIC